MPAPFTPSSTSPALKHPRAALTRIRADARKLRLAAQKAQAAGPAPAAIATVGTYNPQVWSLGQGLQQLLQGLQHLFGSLFGPPPPAAPPPPQPAKGATDFTLACFNLLGSNHTAPGGNNKGYASGVERTRMAVQLLRDKHINVVGFQEMKSDQAREFNRVAGGDYGLFPGDKPGNLMSDNSIAWRKDTWDLVSAKVLDMPSLNGRNQPSPLVCLRNKQTGQEVYFLNIHNAPGFHKGGAEQNWRDRATAKQVALVNQLKQQTGLPVIVTGDFNDKARAFETMTHQAGLHAANEGPGGRMPKLMSLDWLFGSSAAHFSRFARLNKGVVGRITDHGVLTSEVHIGR